MDLSLWCVIQRSRNFTKHSKLWTFFYAAWLRGSAFFKKYKILDLFLKVVVWTPRYLTKHPKLWTFLVSHWVRGPDILPMPPCPPDKNIPGFCITLLTPHGDRHSACCVTSWAPHDPHGRLYTISESPYDVTD